MRHLQLSFYQVVGRIVVGRPGASPSRLSQICLCMMEGPFWLITLCNWTVIRISPKPWGQVNLVPAHKWYAPHWAALTYLSLLQVVVILREVVGLLALPSHLLGDTEQSHIIALHPFLKAFIGKPPRVSPDGVKGSHLLVIFISISKKYILLATLPHGNGGCCCSSWRRQCGAQTFSYLHLCTPDPCFSPKSVSAVF